MGAGAPAALGAHVVRVVVPHRRRRGGAYFERLPWARDDVLVVPPPAGVQRLRDYGCAWRRDKLEAMGAQGEDGGTLREGVRACGGVGLGRGADERMKIAD